MRRLSSVSLLVLILSSLVVDVSASSPIPLLLIRAFRFIIPKALHKLKSLFHRNRLDIGDLVDGLSTIKYYFDIFGYLNSTLDSNNTFTATLQSAIKQYQTNFNIKVTGELDDNTERQMSLPRCGVADTINGSTTMNSGKDKNNTTPFKKWWAPVGKRELTYSFSFETDAATRAVFVKAFGRWSNATMLNFTETTSFNESDIHIWFLSLDGKLGVVGDSLLNYTTKSAKVFLDSNETWAGDSGSLDLESVVMHLTGHLLGLGHSSIENAIMYPSILPLPNKKVKFAKDDVERIQQLYGTIPGGYGEIAPTQSPGGVAGNDSGVAVVTPRWDLVSTLCLGFALPVLFN